MSRCVRRWRGRGGCAACDAARRKVYTLLRSRILAGCEEEGTTLTKLDRSTLETDPLTLSSRTVGCCPCRVACAWARTRLLHPVTADHIGSDPLIAIHIHHSPHRTCTVRVSILDSTQIHLHTHASYNDMHTSAPGRENTSIRGRVELCAFVSLWLHLRLQLWLRCG